LVRSRYDLIEVARAEGLPAPEMLRITRPEDIGPATAQLGLPAMLKVDGTWGGLGVASIANVAEGERQFRARARPLQASRAIKRLFVDRDAFHLLSWLEHTTSEVTMQRFIHGRPANAALACWKGEVVAATYAEAAVTQAGFGASTVARMIDHPGMADTAVRLIRRLGLSGFCGLDFVIEQETGTAHLIEMNPRGTPLTHVALGPGRDLVAALAACAAGRAVPETPAVTDNSLIAFFPQAWHQNPQSKLLQAAFHDVPWEDADLVRELIRPPWPDRGLLSLLVRWLRGASSPTSALRQMVEDRLSNNVLMQPMPSDGKKLY
jgi:predicted ATP-grasp superfamily ATP-dependent carboligase